MTFVPQHRIKNDANKKVESTLRHTVTKYFITKNPWKMLTRGSGILMKIHAKCLMMCMYLIMSQKTQIMTNVHVREMLYGRCAPLGSPWSPSQNLLCVALKEKALAKSFSTQWRIIRDLCHTGPNARSASPITGTGGHRTRKAGSIRAALDMKSDDDLVTYNQTAQTAALAVRGDLFQKHED